MNLIKIVTVGTATILSETKKKLLIKTLIKEGFNNSANRKVDTA